MSETQTQPKWEEVQDFGATDTSRLAVPGGWLYRVRQWTRDPWDEASAPAEVEAMSVVFIPDPARQGRRGG